MGYAKTLALAVVATCTFGVTAALAGLPEWSTEFPNNFTATSTKPKAEAAGGFLVWECSGSETTGTWEGSKAMRWDELELGCSARIFGVSAGKCSGLADTIEGSVLLKGAETLGYRLGTLIPLVVFTIEPAHYECGSNLVVVEGCRLGTITLSKSKTATLEFSGSAGKQTDTDYTTDSGVTKECKLTTRLNAEAAKETDFVQKETMTFTKEAAILD